LKIKHIYLFICFALFSINSYRAQVGFKYKKITDSVFNVGDKIIAPVILFDLSGPLTIRRKESKDSVDVIANFLISHPKIKIELGGHTDSRGKAESNATLSKYRMWGIKDYLVKEKKIDSLRIKTMGFGKSQLLIPDKEILKAKTKQEKEELHAINRRTEIKILALE
jgi:outer membrane protein OmpA-like peptidoglycan-associated protein